MADSRSPGPLGRGFFLSILTLGTLLSGGCQQRPPASVADEVASATPSLSERATGKLTLRQTENGVAVGLPWQTGELWRSPEPLTFFPRESRVQLDVRSASTLDTPVPDGRALYYLARNPEGVLAGGNIETRPVTLPKVRHPRLVMDKLHYTLSVVDGDKVVKRYRVGLGADPVKRKICQDNSTTPEGVFTIYNLQPEASFHKAYDVDYPSDIDQTRYLIGQQEGLVPSGRGIGGEIQIHGRGSFGNWTAGCMALDDEDIDELFQHSELAAGMELFICGSEIKLEDRPWLLHPDPKKVRAVQARLRDAGFYGGALDGQLGRASREALGRYQVEHKLPLTCQLDSATRAHFEN